MIYQYNNWNMLQILENVSVQAIYYQPWSDGPTDNSNTGYHNTLLSYLKLKKWRSNSEKISYLIGWFDSH